MSAPGPPEPGPACLACGDTGRYLASNDEGPTGARCLECDAYVLPAPDPKDRAYEQALERSFDAAEEDLRRQEEV